MVFRRLRSSGPLITVSFLMSLSIRPLFSAGTTTTVFEQVDTLDYSQAPNGSYFPSFKVEERSRWPRQVWPRGEAWSRIVLAERAMIEIRRGAAVVMFASTRCAPCSDVFDIFDEMAIPVSLVSFSPSVSDAQSRHTDRDPLLLAAQQLPGSHVEPWVFLGTRFLGDPYEVRAMLQTGELHGRVRAYGLLPRTEPPENRPPVVWISPLANQAEAERFSVEWESSWVHPVVWGRVEVDVLEAASLVGMAFSYDPVQRKVVRGGAPTPAYPFGEEASNTLVEVRAEGLVNRSALVRGPLEPEWNETLTLFPVRSAEAELEVRLYHVHRSGDPLLAGDAPVLLGAARLPLPRAEGSVQGWYGVGGDEVGEAEMGRVHLRVRYRGEYRARVQQGEAVRVGGIAVSDADALNGTLRVTLEAARGLLSLPSNARIAFVVGDPITREHPALAASRRLPRYGGLGEAAGRIGFVQGDGRYDRQMVVEGVLVDVQAALAELEYDAPAGGGEDRVVITVNDKGHTGQGGNRTGAAAVLMELVEGRENQGPQLHLWPEMRGQAAVAQSGEGVTRYVPLGVEAGLFGLYVEDEDAYGGEVEVTVRAALGVVSVQGLGPWEKHAGARARVAEGVGRARSLAVTGREVSASERRGFFRRTLLCAGPGGFASELLLQGPTEAKLWVRLNDEPGSVIEGAASNTREVTIEAGGAVTLHHDAHDDFVVHYKVTGSQAVNVLVMEHEEYLRYLRGEHFVYHPEASTVEQASAEVRNVLVEARRPSRWYCVIEQARDAAKPGWRSRFGRTGEFQGEEGEIETGVLEEAVAVAYDVRLQRAAYRLEDMQASTGAATPLQPTATALCAWLMLDQEGFAAPSGLDALGITFEVGDGHRDSVMRFRGRLGGVQDALGTLSYFRDDGGVGAPGAEEVDEVRVTVDDRGHTGAGGRKRGSLTVRVAPSRPNASIALEEVFTSTAGQFWDGRVAEVREESRWLDLALEPFAGVGGDGEVRFGAAEVVKSVAVPAGRYTAPLLAETVSEALGAALGDVFWECRGSGLEGREQEFGGACARWEGDPPMQLRVGSGGRIRLEAEEATMTFTFIYDGTEVTNGRFDTAAPCEQGGGPTGARSVCGWWGGRFSLLFGTGENRERSLAAVLGFEPERDYSSTAVQYHGRALAARSGGAGAAVVPDKTTAARLTAPFRYFVDLAQSKPAGMRSAWGANRPPQITLRYKTRADLVSVSVPPGSMAGLCRVRTSGVDYAGLGLDGGLQVEVGIGTIVNRFWQIAPGDVAVRDYAYRAAHMPDPARAQITFEWDYAVVVEEVELVMTNTGVVELEGFVGGVVSGEFLVSVNASNGTHRVEHRALEARDGWVSVGIAEGSAGEGPFAEGERSVFRWPESRVAGQVFRIVVHRSWHYKKWGLYRAFPRWRQRTAEVDGVAVVPRLARVVAGQETALTGVGVEDLDLGADTVQAADLEVRRLRATLECSHGQLFVDAPYTEAAGVSGESGFAARAAGQARGDAEALAQQGDVEVGVSAEEAMQLAQGNTAVKGKAWARPRVPGVEVLELATWRGAGGGFVHFVEGSGVGDRRVVMEGRLAAIQQALRGLRYKGVERADPGQGADGTRGCRAGKMCGQASGSVESRINGHGTRGWDAISMTVSDNGHSDRVCEGGGKDPLGRCELRPGAEEVARAVLEVTVVPRESNQLGYRGAAGGGEEAAFNGPPECLPCYAPHPADADLCLHRELYWGAPHAPGHAYRLSSLQAYSVPQRAVWEQEFRKPCALARPPPTDAHRAPPSAPRAAAPGANSFAHAPPSEGAFPSRAAAPEACRHKC